MVGSRVIVAAAFLALYQVENAVEVSCWSWRPAGVRVSSAKTLNRYEPSPSTVVTSLVLPTGAAKIASVRAWLSWPLAIQPRSPPMLAVGASELSRARSAKSAPSSAWVLRSLRWSTSVGLVHDLDHVPAEGGLDRRQDVAGLEAGRRDRREERGVHAASCCRSTGACRPCRSAQGPDSSSLSLRAIESNRLGSALSLA